MFRAGLRSTWNAFSRPAPTSAWQTFFRTNQQKRTLINASRDNHWPRSPLLPEGKGFNWDAFRWTNYRVAIFASLIGGLTFLLGTKAARMSEAWRNPLNNDWSTYPLVRALPLYYGKRKAWENALPLLQNIVGEEHVVWDDEELARHATTEWSSYKPHPGARIEPHVIVYPENTEQVSDIARVAHKYKLPIVPYSGGTSLEGHFASLRGGICIDFSRMDKIITIHEDDLDAVVQPCVGWEDLNTELGKKGLWFPPDPGPGAKIGGMVGTGCSGTNAGRYGTMKDWVINLTVVLADGTIIKTRQRPRKSSAGYDLTRLFVGSEGTLGLVTEICVKLAVIPAETSVAVVPFPSIRDAANTVAATVKAGVDIAAMELLDDNQMRTINMTKATNRSWAEKPTLFMKFAGTKAGVREAIEIVGKISQKNNGGKFEFAKNEKEKTDLWSARKEALFSVLSLREKGGEVWTTDVAVPISKLPELIEQSKKSFDKSGLHTTIVSHALDGNFHGIILYDKRKRGDRRKAEDLVHEIVDTAIDMEGTCTGEHGIGMVKRDYLVAELGIETVELMRRIKLALDPLELLNPEKIMPSVFAATPPNAVRKKGGMTNVYL